VFITNLDGTGFQREVYPTCPSSIPLDAMLREINTECYKQWQRSREHYHRNPFLRLDYYTNISILLALVLALALFVLDGQNDASDVINYLFVFFFFRKNWHMQYFHP
jgi:hypothetical protein